MDEYQEKHMYKIKSKFKNSLSEIKQLALRIAASPSMC
jgi:hypothetical protein